MEQVYKSSIKLLTPLSPDETYKTIVKEALKLVNGKFGSILLEKNGRLERVYASHHALFNVIPRKRGFMYTVYKSKKPKILNYKEINIIHPSFKKIKAETDIIIPLSYRRKSIGVLSIISRKGETFTDDDLLQLKYFSPLATLAIIKSQLLDETRSALETRDLFISMASHELKTPLTTISAYMQLLEKKYMEGQTIKQEWITTLSRELGRLTNLVNELLQINQIQKGQLVYDKKRFNIYKTIKDVSADFMFANPNRKIVITKDRIIPKGYMIGDQNKIIQVLNNLLNNAAKHSSARETIHIKIGSDKQHMQVSIVDKGPGIHPDDLQKVFSQFYRGRNNQKAGLGLGLYLSREIINEHKGDIKIESELNKGTTVIITLPIA